MASLNDEICANWRCQTLRHIKLPEDVASHHKQSSSLCRPRIITLRNRNAILTFKGHHITAIISVSKTDDVCSTHSVPANFYRSVPTLSYKQQKRSWLLKTWVQIPPLLPLSFHCRLLKWSTRADCKSAGFGLRQFESTSGNHFFGLFIHRQDLGLSIQ